MLTVPPGAYPLRGFAYLCSHPSINAKVGGFLAGASALCITGILALALLTFRSQLRFIGHSFIGVGTLGKVATCLLILAEASLVVYLVFKQTMQVLQRKLFMDVLHGMLSERLDLIAPVFDSVRFHFATVCAVLANEHQVLWPLRNTHAVSSQYQLSGKAKSAKHIS